MVGEGEALVKEGFLEEVGQSRDWKEGRDRVRGKEKKRKSSLKGTSCLRLKEKCKLTALYTSKLDLVGASARKW